MSRLNLTPEQRAALDESNGLVVEESFLLVSRDRFGDLVGVDVDDEALHSELRIGLDQIARGDVVRIDVDEFLTRLNRERDERSIDA